MDLPLHPKIVHLPIALAVLMPLLTSGILLAMWREWFTKRVWSLVIAGQFLLVGSGYLALQSGEEDEERVERVVAESVIEEHAEAGERFEWGGALLLGISVLPLLLRKRSHVLIAGAATCIGTFAVLGLGYQVGQKGGELVYGHNAAAVFATKAQGAIPVRRGAGDDDDR
ncbi:MAG: hypothetical protein KA020_10110 [Planctomycetes bacterium]|jgi:uncharacterized membrane protein|nr:hypothetical protein [Planctomycetota bacterium]MCC7065925.1 hypothetical protein [Planctomycetota bacterium]